MPKGKGAANKEKQMSTAVAEPEVDPTATEPTNSEPEAEKAKRAKTVYMDPTAEAALDELPDSVKAARSPGAGRSKVYVGLLEKVAEQGVDGKWRPLAKFGTSTGAGTVARNLNKQVAGNIGDEKGQLKESAVKEIPEYEGFHWEFDSRRVPGEGDKVESILYAKLVANPAE